MSDPRSLLRAAEAELGRAEAIADQWRAAVTALRKVIEKQPEIAPTAMGAAELAPGASEMSGPSLAAAILKEAGGPLRIKEIVRRMQALGYKTHLAPTKVGTTLYTNMMRQDHKFKRVGKAKFDLVNRAA